MNKMRSLLDIENQNQVIISGIGNHKALLFIFYFPDTVYQMQYMQSECLVVA